MAKRSEGFGPWPQPAPRFFEGAAPAVLNVPDDVQKDWDKTVGRRYFKQVVFETIPAWLWSRRNPGLVPVSDARFCEILCDGIFSKFLTPKSLFDPPDLALFGDYLSGCEGPGLGDGAEWFKSDFTPMRLVSNASDSATAPSVVLFKRGRDLSFEVVAIAVNDQVFDPRHRGAWTRAKYFALQGAGVLTTLLMHPKLHFPSNSVDAITRSRLPADGTLSKLLRPHFRLALAVNYAVLYGSQTVLKPGRLYAPYPGTHEQHDEIVAALWQGFEHPDGTPNRAFPTYTLQLDAPVIHSPYGDFLGHYHRTLLGFVRKVAQEVVATPSASVSRWADYCARWLPGFPDGSRVYDADLLARALTSILLDVSVSHSADHFIYGTVNEREVPFRLHTDLPSLARQKEPDLETLVTSTDNFNYRMCMLMFFRPHVIERLMDIDYGFDTPTLRAANAALRADLVALQATLERQGIPAYVPLECIASSVQF
ncbi:MAG: hypothetical protein ACE37F_03180 [Nannocystaceae bacterium]|nr:hypothetical protein [bacterium]